VASDEQTTAFRYGEGGSFRKLSFRHEVILRFL
jgi:hypothetical protein